MSVLKRNELLLIPLTMNSIFLLVFGQIWCAALLDDQVGENASQGVQSWSIVVSESLVQQNNEVGGGCITALSDCGWWFLC